MTEKEERDLVKKRASYKGRLTAFCNYVNDLEDTLNPSQVNELQLRLSKIENLYSQYDEVQLRIECLVEDINSQISERTDFESTYYHIVSKAQDLHSRNIILKNREKSDQDDCSHRSRKCNPVKLPTIQLPKFSGSYEKWLEFRDKYLSLIHSNDDIDDVNKFHYLRSSLEGSAALVIQSIDCSASNYLIAWKQLCERFDNKRLLIQNHVTALINIDLIKRESSVELKRVIDCVNKNLRSLQSLGEPTQHWDTLLIYIISGRLDSKTFRQWEEFKSNLDKNEIITLEMFLTFLRNRSDLLETIELSQNCTNSHPKTNKHKTLVAATNGDTFGCFVGGRASLKSCPKCQGDHNLSNCSQFLGLSNEKRLQSMPQYKICYNCFRPGHYANQCKSSGCKICKRKHNFLVHVDTIKNKVPRTPSVSISDSQNHSQSPEPVNQSVDNVTLSAQVPKAQVLLATCLIKVINGNLEYLGRAILDSGSTTCLITEKICKSLSLPNITVNESLMGVNSIISHVGKMCNVTIKSLNDEYSSTIPCFVVPTITGNVPSHNLDISNFNIPSNLCLADPQFYSPSSVDILLGADIFWDLLGTRKICLGNGTPVLFETKLGWVVSGPTVNSSLPHSLSTICNVTSSNSQDSLTINSEPDDTQNLLMRFWQLEEVSHQSSVYSREERLCEEHFLQNTTRLEDGRFCVRIPLKVSTDNLGDSKQRAKHCLFALERRLKRSSSFCDRYCYFMKEYLHLNHMSICTPDPNKVAYFIPHHGIVRESSLTTKLRVVFNASSPTTSGLSFNDLQMIGPTVQDDLLSILIRFRTYRYVFSADVEKMYRQIIVHPDDRHLQQILWRSNSSEPVEIYQLNTVTYGTASAPYLATRCLKQIGLECSDSKIATIIKHDFYVDDCLSGSNCLPELHYIRNKLTTELSAAGMSLRKWKSNVKSLVQDDTYNASLDLNIGSLESCKTLGLNWQTDSDVLSFTINPKVSNIMTKRSILSTISQIFDPLGLLSPCIIVMKILIQNLWIHKLNWDDQLPSEIIQTWSKIINSLSMLNELIIPRPVLCDSYKIVDLHIFSDASQTAYGACVYMRSVDAKDNVCVRLLIAKSRVAPIKPMTIPRLELCAVLVGVRLYEKVTNSLRVKVNNVTFWTDSMVVLGWLKMLPCKLQPFVRNRVAEILEKTATCSWRHVSTDLNPADYVSRGKDMSLLKNLHMWWSGPQFLKDNEDNWPHQLIVYNDNLPETRSEVSLTITKADPEPIINFSRFSSFTTLKRSVAYALRFINIVKNQPIKHQYLNTGELQESLYFIIRLSQKESFPEYSLLMNGKALPKKSSLLKFNVFFDENKLIRVGGRLKNSQFNYDKKYPLLIQSNHIVTKLLFEYMHKKLMHAGPQLLLASIRENYWPIGGRCLAKAVYRKCILCTRMRGQIISPLMGNLPAQRLEPGGYPFEEAVGTDYAGPIMAASRQGRGCRLVKVYIILFVCFSTKAVHLELVGDLTSNNFLSTLRRFVSRRGKPKHIYSDNGTSFVGAYNEIGKFLKSNCNAFSSTLANEDINFHFIPPYAPHFGGLWEAGIKSVKYHLKRVLGNCHLSFEELNTVLVQIEAILNSRPLTPMSSDANDFSPLTPGHFLIGRPLTSLPTSDLSNHRYSYISRFQRIEQIRQHFWSRWSKEYVSELQQRGQWKTHSKPLEKDTLVLIKDDHLPPLKWRLGRILEVYPGSDGISRVADVKTVSGIVRRAFSKICPLLTVSTKNDG